MRVGQESDECIKWEARVGIIGVPVLGKKNNQHFQNVSGTIMVQNFGKLFYDPAKP